MLYELEIFESFEDFKMILEMILRMQFESEGF